MKAQTRIVTVGTERFGAQWGVKSNREKSMNSYFIHPSIYQLLYFISTLFIILKENQTF